MANDPENFLVSRVSRRRFLAAAGATGAAVASASSGHSPTIDRENSETHWDDEADLIVCGTGAGGLTAAVIGGSKGQRVIMLEKAHVIGGTTAKSGGAWWAPDNSLMRRDGLVDRKEDAISYMARTAMPQVYDASLPRYGLPQLDYDLIECYYDTARVVTDTLIQIGALRATYYAEADGKPTVDYYSHLAEDKAPVGRALVPADAKGEADLSGGFINQMSEAANRLGVVIRLDHRAERLILDDRGRVIGVEARFGEKRVRCRARQGVVFATGGFTHNPTLADNFLRGPIFGGCAVPTNTGDFVNIASQVGAALGNMNQAWWAEVVLEQALAYASVPSTVFDLNGDSTIAVNRFGRRFCNEKATYNERPQAHFHWDASRAEYTNLLSFMIYDERTAQNPGSDYPYPIPSPGFDAPYVIKASNLSELVTQIRARLRTIAGKSSVSGRVASSLDLAPDFEAVLRETIRQFNRYAKSGHDPDFLRGINAVDRSFRFNPPPNNNPNVTMYPLSEHGPYYCVILGAGTLDTKGGPVVNAKAQVMRADGSVIAGLYAAGNCAASPARQAYWGAGGTIGPAMVMGYLAASHATDASKNG